MQVSQFKESYAKIAATRYDQNARSRDMADKHKLVDEKRFHFYCKDEELLPQIHELP